jgi:hypothetical protein
MRRRSCLLRSVLKENDRVIEQTPHAVLVEAATRFGTNVNDLHPLSGGHCAGVYGFAGNSGECILRVVPETDEMTA